MDTLEAIKQRRSVKHYDPNHQLTQDEVDEIFSLGMLSPTAFNIQNVRYLNVEDKELRQKIREASWNQAQVTDASLLVVVCADLMSWNKDPSRYWKNAPENVQEMMIPAIKQYYEGSVKFQRDEAMRSCGLAAQTLMLAAKSLGYDSCPMDGFDFDKVGELINLPDDHVIAMFVVIGKGIKEAWPRPGQLSMDEVVIKNKF